MVARDVRQSRNVGLTRRKVLRLDWYSLVMYGDELREISGEYRNPYFSLEEWYHILPVLRDRGRV